MPSPTPSRWRGAGGRGPAHSHDLNTESADAEPAPVPAFGLLRHLQRSSLPLVGGLVSPRAGSTKARDLSRRDPARSVFIDDRRRTWPPPRHGERTILFTDAAQLRRDLAAGRRRPDAEEDKRALAMIGLGRMGGTWSPLMARPPARCLRPQPRGVAGARGQGGQGVAPCGELVSQLQAPRVVGLWSPRARPPRPHRRPAGLPRQGDIRHRRRTPTSDDTMPRARPCARRASTSWTRGRGGIWGLEVVLPHGRRSRRAVKLCEPSSRPGPSSTATPTSVPRARATS